MFAEEHTSSKNRKRQEENRARRRRLKQQQQQQQQKEKQKTPSQDAKVDKSSTCANPQGKLLSNVTASAGSSVNFPVSVSSKPSSIEIAKAQRQLRLEINLQKKACVKIQSFYKSFRSNCFLIIKETASLTKRLQDLKTLIHILKKKNNTEYILPQQTVTAFCQQIIFVTHSIPYARKKNQGPQKLVKLRNTERDSTLVNEIFRFVLVPGLLSLDENVNPFAAWMKSPEGKIRIRCMIRLALVTATDPSVDSAVWKSCIEFIMTAINPQIEYGDHDIVQNKSIMSTVAFCRNMVLTKNTLKKEAAPIQSTVSSPQFFAISPSASLDLISLLRNHLLYSTGGAPNPFNSSKLREKCISSKEKGHADALFQMVISAIQSVNEDKINSNIQSRPDKELENLLMMRFFSEILTIPLLTWKVSDASVRLLFSYRQNYLTKQNKLFIMSLIDTFTWFHMDEMDMGDIESVLCQDIPLKQAGATVTQCLLSNMVQLCSCCVQLNGSQPGRLNFVACATYFRFLATLVDVVPLTTFSSRDSVVEWVAKDGHHSPVVLSSVILEHCRMLVTDGWVRKLFQCAIYPNYLNTEVVLSKKNKHDVKLENELSEVGSRSVASVAAMEAKIDRNKSFWKSSTWARSLSKGVSKILNSNKTKGVQNNDKLANKISSGEGGKLINTSAVSRNVATGQIQANSELFKSAYNSDSEQPLSYTTDLFKSLCRVYGIILARWGGNGGEDILYQRKGPKKLVVASSSPEPCTQSLLSLLCFSNNFVRVSWAVIQTEGTLAFGEVPVKATCIRPVYNVLQEKSNYYLAVFYLFIESLSYQLILTDDTEIHDMGSPIPLHQLRRCIITLKKLMYKACCRDDVADSKLEPNYFGLALIQASSKVMRDLYDRSSRRLICAPNVWLVEDLMEAELRRCKDEKDFISLLGTPVLQVCPFLVSFKRRLKLFERIVYTNRVQIQGENSANPFNTNPLKSGIPIRITRGRILEDGVATMNTLGSEMRQRLSIQYYNEAGARESGIDAGGLFKEFWTDLCAIAFDPNYALFQVTEDNCMYPNPSSKAAHGNDHIELFVFLGRILGKALYESITVHPQFAHFFLSFLRGDYNYLHMFSDLSTVDSELYKNLMFLKTYDGDARNLSLSFTVSVEDFGGTREIPLIPNGANIEVDDKNKHRYIGLVTKHYVVDRVKEQSEAFIRGFWEVVDKSWLQIFNEPELQVLISGASDGTIDVADMRAHTQYAGGFTSIDRNIIRFWNAFSSMDTIQQANLLRFVTSCERVPPLGFSTLTPPFTIQRVGIMKDGDKLPTASTCFNILKLPTYSSEKVMKEKLIFVIESGTGFELS